MDEMWSVYHDKKHQMWLWWAIDHEKGEVIAFWFGTRGHENLDKLLELLTPLNLGRSIPIAAMRIMSVFHQRFW
jgi:insertion element IS1 protein InsB